MGNAFGGALYLQDMFREAGKLFPKIRKLHVLIEDRLFVVKDGKSLFVYLFPNI